MMFNYCPACGRQGTVEKLDNTNYECRDCAWHFWNNAKVATALAFVRDGQLLVVKRNREPNKGKFELAGGFIDFGENAYDSAIREAKEELGLTIHQNDLQLIALYHNDYNPDIFTIDIIFLVTSWQGEPTPADDVANFHWQSFDFIYNPQFCQKQYGGLDKLISARLDTTDSIQ